MFDLGDTVRLQATCTDPAGTAVTADTAVLTITLPDGTTATPTVPAPTVAGQYIVDYVTTAAGRHSIRWVFTGPGCAYTDVIDVRPAVPDLILGLATARTFLDLTSTSTDDELREWLESITAGIEHLCGDVVVRTITERHDIPLNGTPTVVLRHTPAIEIISVEPVLYGGYTYAAADLDLDPATGIVQRLDGGWLFGPLRFTYRAGRPITPACLTSASKIILKHLWRTKYGASKGLPSVGGADDYSVTEPVPGFGYAIPNRALQLMEPERLPPGHA